MQWGLGLRDLNLGGREANLAGTVGEPAGKEGFSAAILATDCLENTPARTDSSEFVLQGPIESFKAHRECVQAASRYGAPPQGIHDLQAALGADGHRGLLHQIELPEQQVTVELNCVRGIIAAQDRVAVDVEDALHFSEESRQPESRKLQGAGQGDRGHLPATSIQGTQELMNRSSRGTPRPANCFCSLKTDEWIRRLTHSGTGSSVLVGVGVAVSSSASRSNSIPVVLGWVGLSVRVGCSAGVKVACGSSHQDGVSTGSSCHPGGYVSELASTVIGMTISCGVSPPWYPFFLIPYRTRSLQGAISLWDSVKTRWPWT